MAACWSIYVLGCSDGSLYTGIAKDVRARIAAHNAGRGAKYTRARRPVRLMHEEAGFTHGDALRRERAIKRMRRGAKLALLSKGGLPSTTSPSA